MIIFISSYGYNQESTFKHNMMGDVSKKSMIINLQNRFRYEFLSRIDDIIPFSFIDKENMNLIAEKCFQNYGFSSSFQNIEDVLVHTEEDYNKFGVRLIQKDVKIAILNGVFQKIN
jgi:ATP-dependent Clp protease ATP-binding subunit ClpA